jgi:hypothetical protein
MDQCEYLASHISREGTGKKLKGQVGRKPIAAHVEEKEQLRRQANPKEFTNHRRLTSVNQMVEGGGDTFLFQRMQGREIYNHIASPQSVAAPSSKCQLITIKLGCQ